MKTLDEFIAHYGTLLPRIIVETAIAEHDRADVQKEAKQLMRDLEAVLEFRAEQTNA